jgi:hypothetical protein
MNNRLSIAEIEAQFPDSWILIDQPETDELKRVLSGRVVFASPDRDEVYRKALELPVPRDIAIRCTRRRQPGMAYIL